MLNNKWFLKKYFKNRNENDRFEYSHDFFGKFFMGLV